MRNLLLKGGNIALERDVREVRVGLSWEAPEAGYDLDAWTFALDGTGRVPAEQYFVFFNNPLSPCRTVEVSEDSQDGGSAEGDDEVVTVRLADVPAQIERIVFVVNIHEGRVRGQSFGCLDNAAIRLSDLRGRELTRYNLGRRDASTETSLIFGELYRNKGWWKFRAIAQGSDRGPADLVRGFGVEVDDDAEAQPIADARAAAPAGVPLELAKGRVELTKPGARIRMTKTPSMEFSLYWTDQEKDLGLILHVAYADGTTRYYDWRCLTDNSGAVHHHGDAVHGGANVCERATLRFALDPTIRAVAVIGYSELSNGHGSFRSMGAHAVVDDGAGNSVTVDLNKGGEFSYHAVITVATVGSDGTITIERTSRFSTADSEARPEVRQDGTLSMNTGPEVFKDFDLDDEVESLLGEQ